LEREALGACFRPFSAVPPLFSSSHNQSKFQLTPHANVAIRCMLHQGIILFANNSLGLQGRASPLHSAETILYDFPLLFNISLHHDASDRTPISKAGVIVHPIDFCFCFNKSRVPKNSGSAVDLPLFGPPRTQRTPKKLGPSDRSLAATLLY
jgi:hypothetical protein